MLENNYNELLEIFQIFHPNAKFHDFLGQGYKSRSWN